MTASEQTKIVQYLDEAHAMETGLVRALQEQIAVTPRGRYRTALEDHLRQTRGHADRIARRRRELQGRGNALGAIVGTARDAIGQAVALAKTPLDLVRGSGGEEKVLKNAKDACASEALEIATYVALEELARALHDSSTAELAASIRADEEAMLARIIRELPALTRAVVAADIGGRSSYAVTETGAADTARAVAAQARRMVREQIGSVLGDEPWDGYDEMNAQDIVARLRDADDELLATVRHYERAHKNRATVLRAVERELTPG